MNTIDIALQLLAKANNRPFVYLGKGKTFNTLKNVTGPTSYFFVGTALHGKELAGKQSIRTTLAELMGHDPELHYFAPARSVIASINPKAYSGPKTKKFKINL